MVVGIRDHQKWAAHRQVWLGIELLPPRDRVFLDELALCIEDLDTAIAGIGHQNLSVLIDDDADRLDELSGLGPVTPPRRELLAVVIEGNDAFVSRVGHVDLAAVGADRNAPRAPET